MGVEDYFERLKGWARANLLSMAVLLGIILTAGLWFASPVFHGLLIGFYTNWSFWALVVLGVVLVVVLLIRGYRRPATLIGGAWVLLLIFFLIFGGALAQVRFYDSLEAETLSEIPETEGVRFLPLEVASRAAQNRANEPRVALGDFEPLEKGPDEPLGYVAPRVPNGGFNVFTYQQQGVAVVDGEGGVETLREPFVYGEGMSITDSVNWKLVQERFWATPTDPYYSVQGEEVLMLVPYLKYRLSFPVTIPYWAGTFVVHPDGEIEDLSREEIVNDERFADERLYPGDLARRAAESLTYQNGIWNAWVTRRDVPEIPDLDNTENEMPYLLPTGSGPVWFTALEPYGPSNATYTMLYTDAHTGEYSVYKRPLDDALLGPNRSFGFVTNTYPDFQWIRSGAGGETGNVLSLEPRPVVRTDPESDESVLYWMLSVTTRDSADINLTAFVDSRDGAVTGLRSYEEVLAFARGEDVPGAVPQEGSGGAEAAEGPAEAEGPTEPSPSPDGGETPSGEDSPADLSDEELISLLREAADRLANEPQPSEEPTTP
ncbi:MAG: hypothetical protein H0T57_00775 [Rubrobacter sp.]|nr:hypothetical protein [Rubrobacter sp.]